MLQLIRNLSTVHKYSKPDTDKPFLSLDELSKAFHYKASWKCLKKPVLLCLFLLI